MSMGLVDDDELQKELDSLSGSIRKESHVKEPPRTVVTTLIPKGRKEGDNNVPDSLRKVIAEDALLNGRSSALELASDFGISPSSVSAYTKGATSTTTYDTPSQSIISHINKSRVRAVKRASRTLNSALNSISQEKLDYADAKDLSAIAKDMSVIIKNLEPQKEIDPTSTSTPQFVIFAPSFRKEETFEVINVNE